MYVAHHTSRKNIAVDPMVVQRWASVTDDGKALNQHQANQHLAFDGYLLSTLLHPLEIRLRKIYFKQ